VVAYHIQEAVAEARLRRFLVDYRIGSAEADLGDVDEELRPACVAERDRYRHALELLDAAGGDPLAPFQRAAGEGRVALAASSATHALLPLLASRAGLRLQLDAGARSHRRRFGWDGGFWLPECAYEPGLELVLAEHGVGWFCVDQSRHEEPLAALRPVATEAGPVALTIDWEAIAWLWDLSGYPSDPAYAVFDGKSLRGMRIWRIGGGAYDPTAAMAAARRQAGEFLEAIAARNSSAWRRAAAAAASGS
jgi:1,4-alpha-glucan branching enzyme